MKFPKFLDILKANNSHLFKAEKIEITIINFEKILEYTYKNGYKEADNFHVNLKSMDKKDNINYNDLFGGIFGGKK